MGHISGMNGIMSDSMNMAMNMASYGMSYGHNNNNSNINIGDGTKRRGTCESIGSKSNKRSGNVKLTSGKGGGGNKT